MGALFKVFRITPVITRLQTTQLQA